MGLKNHFDEATQADIYRERCVNHWSIKVIAKNEIILVTSWRTDEAVQNVLTTMQLEDITSWGKGDQPCGDAAVEHCVKLSW